MNILIDAVPSTLLIGGTAYRIRTDFRIWIMFEQMIQDDEIMNQSIAFNVAKKLIFETLPPACYDIETAQQILWFYQKGETEKDNLKNSIPYKDRIYDYDTDGDYIYAAFLQQYTIDLQTVQQLHWWQFRALFAGLTDNCKISQIMGYRSVEITSNMSKDQQQFYRKMKNLYALPLPKNEQEKIRILEEQLLQRKPLEKI